MIKIDDWVIEKGEKAQGKIEITGCGMAMPATVICGVEDGPTILITAGRTEGKCDHHSAGQCQWI